MLQGVSSPKGDYLEAFHSRKSPLLIPGGQLTLSPGSTEFTLPHLSTLSVVVNAKHLSSESVNDTVQEVIQVILCTLDD